MRSGFVRLFAVAALGAAALAADVPRPSPELKVNVVNGDDFELSKLRGNVVALSFIFTTCSHCQHTSVITNKLLGEYRSRGFRAVAIACNEGADALAPEFVTQFDIRYPVGVTTVEKMFAWLGEPPHQFQLPQLLFIDRKGIIRAQLTGENQYFTDEEANMRKMIEKLLAEPYGARTRPAARKRNR